jgi:hypothetical protein
VRRALLAVFALLTLAGCTSTLQGGAAGPRDTGTPKNLALIDVDGTAKVLAQAKEAVEAVFSYDGTRTDKVDAAVKQYLRGAAVDQVGKLLAAVRAESGQVSLTTTVTGGAALELTDSHARVLQFLRQVSTHDGQASTGVSRVVVDLTREGSTWPVSGIDVDPTSVPESAEPLGGVGNRAQVASRDQALADGRDAVKVLLSDNWTDPQASVDRWLAVLADPLLSQYRGQRSSLADGIRDSKTTATVTGGPIVGGTEFDDVDGTMSALAAATVTVVREGAAPTTTRVALDIQLRRGPDGWKLASIDTVSPS